MAKAHLNRRQLIVQTGCILAVRSAVASALDGTSEPLRNGGGRSNDRVEYGKNTLPMEIRSRRVYNNNGLTMHILEAGFEGRRRPCVVLLHGFPELAYTWRHQLVALARAGFHAVAPDLRGYGRSAVAREHEQSVL